MAPIYTEIADIRSEPMRVVKRALILIIIVVCGCGNMDHVRKVIQGTFYEKNPPINYGASYSFKGNKFKIGVIEDTGIRHKSAGTYRIEGDTLILNYCPIKDPNPTTYTFLRKVAVSKKKTNKLASGSINGHVKFRVYNKKGEPFSGAILALLDSTKKIVKAYTSDKNGYFPRVNVSPSKVRWYKVYLLAKKPILLPVTMLNGYNSKIKVTFSDSAVRYSNYNGATKYLIKKATPDRLILKRLNYTGNFKRLVLQREDSL